MPWMKLPCFSFKVITYKKRYPLSCFMKLTFLTAWRLAIRARSILNLIAAWFFVNFQNWRNCGAVTEKGSQKKSKLTGNFSLTCSVIDLKRELNHNYKLTHIWSRCRAGCVFERPHIFGPRSGHWALPRTAGYPHSWCSWITCPLWRKYLKHHLQAFCHRCRV